jgi:hypothetical protein
MLCSAWMPMTLWFMFYSYVLYIPLGTRPLTCIRCRWRPNASALVDAGEPAAGHSLSLPATLWGGSQKHSVEGQALP